MSAPEPLSAERLDQLEALAIRAEADNPSPWVPYFTVHGDPYVNLSPGRGLTSIGRGTVCTVSTGAVDYGKSTAEHIAAADPVTVIALIDENRRLRSSIVDLEAERDSVRAQLEIERVLMRDAYDRRAAADTPKLQAAQRWNEARIELAVVRKAYERGDCTLEQLAASADALSAASEALAEALAAAFTEEPAAPKREALVSLMLPSSAVETMSTLGWATFGEGDEDARDAALDAFIDACRRARPDLAPNYDRPVAAPPATPAEPIPVLNGKAYCLSCGALDATENLWCSNGFHCVAAPGATTPETER